MKKNTKQTSFSITPLSSEAVDAITVCYLANFWNRYCHEFTKKEKESFNEIYGFFTNGQEHAYTKQGENPTLPTKEITKLVINNLNSFLININEDIKKFEDNLKLDLENKKNPKEVSLSGVVSTLGDFTYYLLLSYHMEHLLKTIKKKSKTQEKELALGGKSLVKIR